jgi:hypothetical protein
MDCADDRESRASRFEADQGSAIYVLNLLSATGTGILFSAVLAAWSEV